MSYLRYLCLFAHSGIQHILCSFLFFRLRLVYPMLPVSLGYPFFFAPSAFSNVYLQTKVLFYRTNMQKKFKLGISSYVMMQ
jgi:hypothetical protein